MGFGELIFFGASILEFLRASSNGSIKLYLFLRFWLFFLGISLFGYFYDLLILNGSHGSFNGMLFDFSGYSLVMFSCFALENLISKNRLNVAEFLSKMFYYCSTVLGLIYIYSHFSSSLFGYPIKYYHYFVPLAKNLHQVSMFLVPLPFIGLLALGRETSILLKIYIILLICLDAIMAFNTGSDKAILALILGTIVFLIFTIYCLPKQRLVRFFWLIIYALIISVLIIINYNFIASFFIDYFHEIDGGGARAYLYSNAISIGLNSPIIGLGTGPHIHYYNNASFSDAHQTYLTIFLQTGLIGLLVFFYLIFKIFFKQILNPPLIAALSTIILYASGGDILRRLPIWIILLLIYYYPVKDKKYRASQYN